MARRAIPDVLVVIPGILGSVLHQDNREVWGLSIAAGMHALTSLGQSLRDLVLTEDPNDPEHFPDGVRPVRILPDLHQIPYVWKIDGYTSLTKALAQRFTLEHSSNYWEFPYDWRRDNRVAAHQLKRVSDRWLRDWRNQSGNTDAKLIIVAHSMGGLVARYFLEVLEGWRDTKALITFGTPFRGSVNALATLVKGVRKGPFGAFDLSDLARSFTSLYQLLPTYPCFTDGNGQLLRLTDCGELPYVVPEKVRDAATFHGEITQAVDRNLSEESYLNNRYRIVPVVGTHQETYQSARYDSNGTVEFLHCHADRNFYGDGTVPRFSATPIELSGSGMDAYVATRHASLQNARGVIHHACEVITGLDWDLTSSVYRSTGAAPFSVSLDLEDAYWDDEPVSIKVLTDPGPSPDLQAIVSDVLTNKEVVRVYFPSGSDDWASAEIPPMPPGVYRCTVEGTAGVHPTVDVFTVYDHRR